MSIKKFCFTSPSCFSSLLVSALLTVSVGLSAQENDDDGSDKPDFEITPSPLTEAEIEFLNSGNQSVGASSSAGLSYPQYPDNIFAPIDNSGAGALSAGTVRLLITVEPNVAGNASFSNSLDNAISRKAEVIEALSSNPSATVIQDFDDLPILLIEIDGSSAQSLASIDAIGAVEIDQTTSANHTSSIPVIDARNLQLHSTTGAGFNGGNGDWSVAVLDTGVRTSHSAFTGRVKSEACFVSDSSCPNNTNTMIGVGAASDCGTPGGRCFHGTHVSGTAVGEFGGLLSHDGVAPGAGLHAIQVFDAQGSGAQFSDIVRGLNYVNDLVLGGERIASANMSLGTSTAFAGQCDAFSPSLVLVSTMLRNNGVMVIAAAGNSFTSTGMGIPACLSPVVAIGNTQDNDVVAASSSASSELNVWAPGTSILSATDSGDSDLTFLTGTSMAAPHVAGAVAMLRECYVRAGSSAASPNIDDTILGVLERTGVDVTDNRIVGGVTKPRIDVGAAARLIRRNDTFSQAISIGLASGRFLGLNTCATAEPEEPGHRAGAVTTGSVWYDYQAPAAGLYTFTTCDSRTSFDTVLAAYTGNTVSNLSLVASNDDSFISCGPNILASRIAVPLVAGQSLKLAVSGYGALNENGQTGVFDLNWTSTPATCNGLQATIIGTNGNDVITGTPGDDVIVTFGGADDINGLGGNDTICAGIGDDTVLGGVGNDYINAGNGNDDIEGQLGNDRILGGNGNDLLNGGLGDDTVDGGTGNDTINGGIGADVIAGGDNDDIITGGDGNDSINGGLGLDTISGGDGSDNIQGGLGDDLLSGDIGNDSVLGNSGNDTINGGAGIDTLNGGLGDDSIFGGFGNDNIFGWHGNDLLVGGPGNDSMRGSLGNDTLRGNAGDDVLVGGLGNDIFNGGIQVNGDECVTDGSDTAQLLGCEVVR